MFPNFKGNDAELVKKSPFSHKRCIVILLKLIRFQNH